MSPIKNILSYKDSTTLAKYEQIYRGIVDAIDLNVLEIGDRLPTLNKLKKELGFSGVTISKGYDLLKSNGIIESKDTIGYYVVSKETKSNTRVALVLSSLNYHEIFYNTFQKELGETFSMDVFYHTNTMISFESVLSRVKRLNYERYVIEPVTDSAARPLIESFDSEKLIVINNSFSLGKNYTCITDEFAQKVFKKVKMLG